MLRNGSSLDLGTRWVCYRKYLLFIIMFESRKTFFWSVQQLVESFSSKSWWRNLESTWILIFWGFFLGWWTCLSRWHWGVWPGYISFQNNCITSECRMIFLVWFAAAMVSMERYEWRSLSFFLYISFSIMFDERIYVVYDDDIWFWYIILLYIMYYYINCLYGM